VKGLGDHLKTMNYNRKKFHLNTVSVQGSYYDLSLKPVNPFVCTPGSFISDIFFYDELSRIAGVESGHNWFCTQMAARSKGTTLTPSTPCKSPYGSAPGSPRTRPHSADLDESLDFVLPVGVCDNTKIDSISGNENRGLWSFTSKGSCGAENGPPIRLASTGFIKRNEYRNLQNWRRWKSYDGARQAILEGEGQTALAEHEYEEAKPSSLESSSIAEVVEQVAALDVTDNEAHSSPEMVPSPVQPCSHESPSSTEPIPKTSSRPSSPPRYIGSSSERQVSTSEDHASTSLSSIPLGATSPPRTAMGRKGSMDLRLDSRGGFIVTTDGDVVSGLAGRSLTMRELTELVSSEQREDASAMAESMALLFTDAAHTVLE
jgi:hypothetical protein